MSTEVLIGIQVLVVLLLVIGMLLLLLRRQRKTITQLRGILTEFKDDISGDTLVRHLQLEVDNTTAHCRQETIALKPDLAPEDMAISLRFIALQTELALVQDRVGTNTPWREQIKRYEELAQKIHDLIRARVDHATKILNDAHNDELGEKDQTISQLESVQQDLQQQLKALKPLQSFVHTVTGESFSPQEIEQKLHRALLDICENFGATEKLRELVFLLHEAFNDMGPRNESTMMQYAEPAPEPLPARKATVIDPSQNVEMLNNIITKQNETIRTLRKQIDALSDLNEKELMHSTVDEMQSSVQASEEFIQQMQQDLETPPVEISFDDAEMHRIIEQFTEESATMVEKIHLLSNENKQLMLENEQMRQSLEADSDSDQPLVAGLKLKIEKQNKEIIDLQTSFKDLEEKYLELYSEKAGN